MNAIASPCSIQDCSVQTTGKCRLGNDPVESCPKYGHNEIEVPPLDEEWEAPPVKSAPAPIVSGDVMHLDGVVEFSRQRQIRTVALVGEHKAGKTTLLASMYEMYCKGPFADAAFAGSRTLVGFAKRHHLALLSSKRTSPTVPRTSRDDPTAFFHLALAKRPGSIVDLVISDRSGEAYGFAREATDLIPTLSELALAQRICFVLDGARIASLDERTAYTRRFKQMIHALNDNGALAHKPVVEVLSTKFDITKTRTDSEDQVNFLAEYEQRLVDEFSGCGLEVSCYRVCALPKNDQTVGFAVWTRTWQTGCFQSSIR
ncbi:TRAFAC clade GTPase domain-containing protein [Ralstonia pseudosolanacearum]